MGRRREREKAGETGLRRVRTGRDEPRRRELGREEGAGDGEHELRTEEQRGCRRARGGVESRGASRTFPLPSSHPN